jgi:hypothetical protein
MIKAPIAKKKKVLNDMQVHVLQKHHKEYLRNQNVQEAFLDLEEVQSQLCNRYFSHDRIHAIEEALSKSPKIKADKNVLKGSLTDKIALKLSNHGLSNVGEFKKQYRDDLTSPVTIEVCQTIPDNAQSSSPSLITP